MQAAVLETKEGVLQRQVSSEGSQLPISALAMQDSAHEGKVKLCRGSITAKVAETAETAERIANNFIMNEGILKKAES